MANGHSRTPKQIADKLLMSQASLRQPLRPAQSVEPASLLVPSQPVGIASARGHPLRQRSSAKMHSGRRKPSPSSYTYQYYRDLPVPTQDRQLRCPLSVRPTWSWNTAKSSQPVFGHPVIQALLQRLMQVICSHTQTRRRWNTTYEMARLPRIVCGMIHKVAAPT
ncbi:hypothetical protein K505DRAFT_18145 [Melanomma pulvis-pyrius CBS 109.77]|uniref:Uncharacterized protein n=1 Tax=Melanomma pulvis-pyrius CBS 109.77 TaxID=1314802 RepID=A0A6A6XF16_9PLEO|nr:hypothetical protein K505DRAFT_18145 [Melanomma pulvis-pyrius CBS 109.77]